MRTETWAGSARGGTNWETPLTAGLLHLLQGSPQLPLPPAGPDRSFLGFGALAMIRYYAKPISAALQDLRCRTSLQYVEMFIHAPQARTQGFTVAFA